MAPEPVRQEPETGSDGSRTQRRKRYEEIAEHLQLLIYSGALKVGAKLPSERELMDRFNVGRSTVREALFSLSRMGLISISSGSPARVIRPDIRVLVSDLTGAVRHMMVTPGGIRNLQHARTLLEVGLAREAAFNATDEDLEMLKQALRDNEAAIGNQPEFERTDLAFHFAIATISNNPIFTALHDGLTEWLAQQRSVTVRAGAAPKPVFMEHKAVFDAIASHDAIGAQSAMETHLSNVMRNYWKAFGA